MSNLNSSQDKHLFFRSKLLDWYSHSLRPLPWKAEKDPYLVWLSEIILQQTRVEQGLPYYQKFKQNYPTVQAMAQASQDAILKHWEGLGYYSRARNMHEAAQYVANQLSGQFPSTYKDLLKLKGVGPYTAAAIASFAYDLPHAVVDGNVFRVLSRYLGADCPIDTTFGKRFFNQQAQQILDQKQPGLYNQAIMDFGATVCRPKKPTCTSCPMQSKCIAFQDRTINQLPVKSKKITRQQRYFHFVIFNIGEKVYIRKRTGKDIWLGLYEFPLIETKQPVFDQSLLINNHDWKGWLKPNASFLLRRRSKPFQQTLTHQLIAATFWEFDLSSSNLITNPAFLLLERKNLSNFAFPKVIDWYLNDNSLYLNL